MTAIWTPILGGLGGVDTSDGMEGHLFFNSGTSTPAGPPPDVWTVCDLTTLGIPVDAVAVDVSGLLIITMGSTPGWSNLCMAFRKPGDARVSIRNHYVFQCIANAGDGMRSPCSTVLTPVGGCIEWAWFTTGATLGWPVGAAVAANLSFTRWMK